MSEARLRRSEGPHLAPRRRDPEGSQAAGRSVIPEIAYADIAAGKVSDATRAEIRKTGCAIVRGVFPRETASGWFDDVSEYLEANRYEEKEIEKRSLDKYFSQLKAGKPQIFNLYWSKPQMLARQDEKLAKTRSFLDRLWTNYDGVFDPDMQVHLCRPRAPPPARRQDARPLAAHGRRHGRALDRPRLPERLRGAVFRATGAATTRSTRASAGDARNPLARRRQRLPHLSGLDGADPPGTEGRNARADPDRRRHLLRAAPRADGRCGGGRPLRRRAGPRARRQQATGTRN